MIKVVNPGMFTSIQDLGRPGFRNMGVPLGGAMDKHAAKLANTLLGNEPDVSVIEFTSPGPEFIFDKTQRIVLTGADLRANLNGRIVPMYRPLEIPGGSSLKFRSSESMMWGYMGVSAEIKTDRVLGSCGYTRGVTDKYRLVAGDLISFKKTNKSNEWNGEPNGEALDYEHKDLVVCKGPEFDRLPIELREKLAEGIFTVSGDINRMAYVLDGEFRPGADEIITAPVQPGTVQMTGSGKLIVLMRDAQTTGGYGRVLQLNALAMNILSQKRAGQPIRFNLVN